MSEQIRVTGSVDAAPDSSSITAEVFGRDVHYEVHQRVTTRAGGARGAQQQIEIGGRDSDVLEIETADGLVHFQTVGSAREVMRSRGGSQLDLLFSEQRGAGTAVASVTRSTFEIHDPDIQAALADLQKSLTEKAMQGIARAALNPVARAAMKRIADWLDRPVSDSQPAERRRRGAKQRGCYWVGEDLMLEPPGRLATPVEASRDPYLVLLHGTFSHTEAAFGGLRGTSEWKQLVKRYDGRVIALEHATLGTTPAENALGLMGFLPEGTTIHLLSHSRGGLIGEAMALAAAGEPDLSLYDPREQSADLEVLPALAAAMADRKVERFLRAACPGTGTILASRRVDSYASYLLNVLKLVPGLQGTGVPELVKLTLLTFLDQRSDPRIIPGLEAMMPESPFIRTLNSAPHQVSDGMASVAGDIEGKGVLQRLKVIGADLFFRQDHDMVVNTSAMTGGVTRQDPRVAFFKGAGYSHSNYFSDPTSRSAVTGWLTANDIATVGGFAPSLPKPKRRRLGFRGNDAGMTGTILFVPDLMGSKVSTDGTPTWPEPRAFVRGLEPLAGTWEVGDPVEEYDEALAAFGRGHAMKFFAYDGRKKLDETADALATHIDKILEDSPQPLHLFGHGTGGLIVRLAHDRNPDLLARTSGKVVLVSPPLHGTGVAAARLRGQDLLSAALAVLSGEDPKTVGETFRECFPSLSELEPGAPDTGEERDWSDYLLVYGRAAETLDVEDERLVTTARGDGYVTWDSCPPRANALFAEAPFQALLDDDQVIAVMEGFFADGTGGSDVRPPSVSVSPGTHPAPDGHQVLFPSSADLVWMSMGGAETPPPSRPALRVRVVHGNLAAAAEPLIVGTQHGTPIGGAEKALDDRLGGVLSRHRLLGQYPGPMGTCQLFLSNDDGLPGAVVIGTGSPGDLGPGALAAAMTQAALRLVAANDGTPDEPGGLDVGAVVIGTGGTGALPIASAVAAIITGVRRANRRIRDLQLPGLVSSLTLYEMYEDRAIEALNAAIRLSSSEWGDDDELDVALPLIEGIDARFGTARSEYHGDRWRTIRVSAVNQAGGDEGELVDLMFTEIGRTAGAPSPITQTQRSIIEQLVRDSIASPMVDEQIYNTMYELLTPRSMKGQGRPSENIMYLLDPEAASLPFEMLATRSFDDGVVPLGIEVGMVRRLETTRMREVVRPSSARRALVIGNPYAGPELPSLPGAAREAESVACLLESRGWEVNRVIRTDAAKDRSDAEIVLNALFAHEYRVVHIAGHGLYTADAPTKSGLSIGSGVMLTSYELEQLQTTPDLVFLNCCHSGAGVGDADRLAASVSRQLIDIGIRAVVAAGWAVDDAAATTFADTFYDRLLDGDYFGNAVLDARKRVFTEHRSVNTWGAYQVYGEPAFQIEHSRSARAERDIVSRHDFHERLETLTQRARLCLVPQIPLLAGELSELQQTGQKLGWMQGEEHQAFGEAWRALGEYDRAIESYREALGAGSNNASVAIVIQLVSAQAHLGAEHARHGGEEASDHFRNAEALLDLWTTLLSTRTPSASETQSETVAQLLKARGNLLQHKIWAATPDTLDDALAATRTAFEKAERAYDAVARARGADTVGLEHEYVRLSHVVLTWLDVVCRQPDGAVRRRRSRSLVRKVECVKARAATAPWSTAPFERLREPDADLVLHLLNEQPSFDDVGVSYRRVFDKGISVREREAIVDYLDWILACLPAVGHFSRVCSALKGLRADLDEEAPRASSLAATPRGR